MKASVEPVESIQSQALLRQELHFRLSEDDVEIMHRCICLSSMVWVGRIDGAYACSWGLIPPSLMSNQAYLWLHTDQIVEEHQFIFVRRSQQMMAEMLKEFPAIIGDVHVKAPRSIRWLKWLGAEFGKPNGVRLPFQIRAK